MEIQFKMNRRVPHIGLVSCLRWPLLCMYPWFFCEHKMWTNHTQIELHDLTFGIAVFFGWGNHKYYQLLLWLWHCEEAKLGLLSVFGKSSCNQAEILLIPFLCILSEGCKSLQTQKPGSMYSFTHKFVHKHPHQCFIFLANRTAPRHFQGHAKVQR